MQSPSGNSIRSATTPSPDTPVSSSCRSRTPTRILKHYSFDGAPGGNRTPDPGGRSSVLYPAELQARIHSVPGMVMESGSAVRSIGINPLEGEPSPEETDSPSPHLGTLVNTAAWVIDFFVVIEAFLIGVGKGHLQSVGPFAFHYNHPFFMHMSYIVIPLATATFKDRTDPAWGIITMCLQ